MFKRIFIFLLPICQRCIFSQTLLVFWLFKNGFGLPIWFCIIFLSFLIALVGIFILPRNKISAKKALFWGVLFSAFSVLVLIKIYGSYQLYISAILSGLNVIFFWIPYNIMHFKFSREIKGD